MNEFSSLIGQQVPFTIRIETATFTRDYRDGLSVETEDSNEITFTDLIVDNYDNAIDGLLLSGGTPFRGTLDSDRIPVRQPFPFTNYLFLHSTGSGYVEGTAEGSGVP